MSAPPFANRALPSTTTANPLLNEDRAGKLIGLLCAVIAHLLFIGLMLWLPGEPPITLPSPLSVALISPQEAPAAPRAPATPPAPKTQPAATPVSRVATPTQITAPANASTSNIPVPEPETSLRTSGNPGSSSGKDSSKESLPISAPRFDAAYLNNPAPPYPGQSRRLGEQGKVELRVHVTAGGQADQVEIKKSSGYPRLDNAAMEAVRNWRFVPAKRGSETIAEWVVVPVNFTLES